MRSMTLGSSWKVLLQPQFGAMGDAGSDTGVSDIDFRSQCFLVKTGKSEKAQ